EAIHACAAALEVMSGIRAVERLVAQREVGDDVALDRRLEQGPLEPRRVAQVAAIDRAVGTDPEPREDVAAEPFDQGHAFRGAACASQCGHVNRSWWQLAQDLLDQAEALLHLADADPEARIHVARLNDRDLELQSLVRRVAGRAP